MGFRSKSYGLGKDRRVFVQKIRIESDTDNGFVNIPGFTFSEETKWVLCDLFAHYPPGDNLWDMVGKNSDSTVDKTKQNQDDFFSRPSMSKTEIARRLEALSSRINKVSNLKQLHVLSLSFQLEKSTCMDEVDGLKDLLQHNIDK